MTHTDVPGGMRLFLGAHLISSVGTRMQTAALLWHSYALTSSAISLGLVGAFELIPLLLLSAWGGVVADRADRRYVLLITQLLMAIPALALAFITWSDQAHIAWIYGATMIAAAVQAFDIAARKALVAELTPTRELGRVMSWMDLAKNIAKLSGPALMGILAAQLGLWMVYLINAISYSVMVFALVKLPAIKSKQKRSDTPQLNVRQRFTEGLRFVRGEPVLKSLIALDFFATLFAGAEALLPMVAVERLGIEVGGYGLLASASAGGALIGGIFLLARPPQVKLGLWSLGSAVLYGVATVIFGLASSVLTCAISLALVGCADTISTVLRNTLMQLQTPNMIRGRVTSISAIFSKSGPRLGQLEAGIVAAHFGLVTSIVSGGLLCVGSVILVGLWSPALRSLNYVDVPPDDI